MYADIVVGIQHGDEGKGKVTHHLLKSGEYTHCLRFQGGNNAGHTIYHEGKKFVTHSIPAGLFFGVKSIIGSGCVVNVEQFLGELKELEEGGVTTEGLIFIAKNTHVITNEHLDEEEREEKIGTTRRGNGPAYRDKYARTGTQAKDVKELQPYLIDLYEEFHGSERSPIILCEGAQGFGLDIDHGDYPFVTSSHCTVAGALLNSIPPSWVRDVWGVAKIYETYVGSKNFEPPEAVFPRLRELGEEYGATTGRPRQCNWTNMSLVEKASRVNGVTKLVFNKVDILRELGEWNLIIDGEKVNFRAEEELKECIEDRLESSTRIYFSDTPHSI